MATFGKSLLRSKKREVADSRAKYAAVLEEHYHREGAPPESRSVKEKSIWETNNLENVLSAADAKESGYMAERNVRIVVGGEAHLVSDGRVKPQGDNSRDWFSVSEQLPIPTRPEWSYKMDAKALEAAEKDAFTQWRHSLRQLEESNRILLTPYEKNLEVWRQLWRVVERSDVVFEILDARNPLAFRCKSFEEYVRRHTNSAGKPKEVVLLLNKADLLSERQRIAWASYLTQRGFQFFFFSAKQSTQELLKKNVVPATKAPVPKTEDLTAPTEEAEEGSGEEDEEPDEAAMTNRKLHNEKRKKRRLRGAPVLRADPYAVLQERKKAPAEKEDQKEPTELEPTTEEQKRNERISLASPFPPHAVLSPENLIDVLATLRTSLGITGTIMAGMVGYPNVGKSSTINAIIGCKKVVVSATPGKTKHFQTLKIPNERRVALCDCPGLVFPSFAATRESMVCDGILPVDTVRDFMSAVGVVCRRIPTAVLERFYNVDLTPANDVDGSTSAAERVLNMTARQRGIVTDHGKPNASIVAKDLLKRYVDGALVYVQPPPDYTGTLPEDVRTALTQYTSPPAVEPAKPENGEGEKAVADEANPKQQQKAPEKADNGEEEEDEEEWEDISSADDARALSEGEEEVRPRKAVTRDLPQFVQRGAEVSTSEGLTPAEAFNCESNMNFVLSNPKTKRKGKKRLNHQYEPDPTIRINAEGEKEVVIDSDDAIVTVEAPGAQAKPKEKRLSKRRMRQMEKQGVVPTLGKRKVLVPSQPPQ